MKEYYETLGLTTNASRDEIQEAYDRLSRELNPENHESKEFFKEEFQKVQMAYEALMGNTSILQNNSPVIKTHSSATSPANNQKENQSGSVTVTISREKIEELKNKRVDDAHLDKNKRSGSTWAVILGFLFAILGGWLGIAVGINYMRKKYDKDTNNTGLAMIIVAIVMMFFWIAISS